MKNILSFLLILIIHCEVFAQWIQCNGPLGGDITCLSQNNVTNTIFAGSNASGLFRYKNSVGHWENLLNVLPHARISEVAVLDSVVFVSSLYDGLFKSNNDGNTWNKITVDTSTFFYSSHTDNLFSNDSLILVTKYAKAYKSNNFGATFTQIPPSIPDTANYIIDIIMQGTRLFTLSSSIANGNTIYFTDDMGQTWQTPATSIPSSALYGMWTGFRIFGNNIYAFGQNYIYLSQDNGVNWTNITPSGITGSFNDIYVSSDTVLLATVFSGTYFSVDSGNSYQQSFIGLPLQKIESRRFLKSNLHSIVLSTALGVFNTNNSGTTWNDFNNGLIACNTYNICTGNNQLFAGTMMQGIFSSIDGGNTWLRKSNGLENYNHFRLIQDMIYLGSRLIAGTDNGVYYSNNNGNSWIQNSSGLTNEILHFTYSQGKLYAGTVSGIYYSIDSATTWNKITSGPSCMVPVLLVDDSLIICENACYPIIPPYFTTEIKRSVNYGASFSTVNSSYEFVDIEKLDSMIIAANQYAYLVKSFDNGITWNIDSTFVQSAITDIYIADSKFIFLGTDSGKIYFSNDTGVTWTNITGNFQGISSRFLKIGNTLFISSTNSGVWKGDITNLLGIQTNSINNIFLIYPNPFYSSTTLQTDNSLHNATLTVYNCFGQMVKQLKNINGQMVTLSRDNLASGLYFVRLTEDSKVIVADKLIITDN
ncbi:MAG: T9SS type A sorting domain-containing protein [Bacteroidetes bacterium]|nr:T9SS type A sorting domain-containing protein [Bacteroidota bacterium]